MADGKHGDGKSDKGQVNWDDLAKDHSTKHDRQQDNNTVSYDKPIPPKKEEDED